MQIYSEHFRMVEEKAGFPEKAVADLKEAAEKIDGNEELNKKFSALVKKYMTKHPDELGRKILPDLEALESYGINRYTLDLIFIMTCSEILHKRYTEKGLSDELFWQFTIDFRCKLLECMDCKGVSGTFVADWNDMFFSMERFALGRFQFEYSDISKKIELENGYKIRKGQKCVNMHIPSMGISLTDDVRLDSYKQAYNFFTDLHTKEGYLIIHCGSWLLFPKHKEFLDPASNILKFDDDFEIYEWAERDNFNDDWRIWGHFADLPLEERPADTKLRKAYRDWMTAGNKTGYGRGIILFDGEKIVNR